MLISGTNVKGLFTNNNLRLVSPDAEAQRGLKVITTNTSKATTLVLCFYIIKDPLCRYRKPHFKEKTVIYACFITEQAIKGYNIVVTKKMLKKTVLLASVFKFDMTELIACFSFPVWSRRSATFSSVPFYVVNIETVWGITFHCMVPDDSIYDRSFKIIWFSIFTQHNFNGSSHWYRIIILAPQLTGNSIVNSAACSGYHCIKAVDYWPYFSVRGVQWKPVDSPYKGSVMRVLFSIISSVLQMIWPNHPTICYDILVWKTQNKYFT